ncbi:MAG TPA: HNH endonuclease signature motif containing protein, partial [Streptosporangiaceae bacterium]|nr:HNH endonuclease signature motif containing protein [Streptosporangiaceae bacterium]
MPAPSVRQPERNRRNFARAMRRDGCRCRYCGEPADCVDHIVPVCYRSDNVMANLAAACTSCNLTVGGMVFPSFDAKRAYIREA